MLLSLILLLFSGTAAAAGVPGLDFDGKILDFEAYSRDEPGDRYIGPDRSLLVIAQEKMSPAQARKELKNRKLQLELLFAPHGATYPGMLTKSATCAQEAHLAANVNETTDSLYWFSELPSTAGLVYGSCGAIEEPYWSEKLMIYCKAQGVLYDVRFFRKRAASKNFIGKPLAKCRVGS